MCLWAILRVCNPSQQQSTGVTPSEHNVMQCYNTLLELLNAKHICFASEAEDIIDLPVQHPCDAPSTAAINAATTGATVQTVAFVPITSGVTIG